MAFLKSLFGLVIVFAFIKWFLHRKETNQKAKQNEELSAHSTLQVNTENSIVTESSKECEDSSLPSPSFFSRIMALIINSFIIYLILFHFFFASYQF